MKNFGNLIINDLKQIFREGFLRVFLFMPLLLLLLSMYGIAPMLEAVPALKPYGFLFVQFAAVQGAIMMAFIMSAVLLEEKESDVHRVYRILPLSVVQLMAVRLCFSGVLSFTTAYFILLLNGVHALNAWEAVPAALPLFAFGPLFTLLVVAFSKNRMEGMTFFKGFDLLVILPAVYYLTDHPGREWLRLLPTLWIFEGMKPAATHAHLVAFVFSLGLCGLAMIVMRRRYWAE
jgi:fluoroquinolone transport system permease protein